MMYTQFHIFLTLFASSKTALVENDLGNMFSYESEVNNAS